MRWPPTFAFKRMRHRIVMFFLLPLVAIQLLSLLYLAVNITDEAAGAVEGDLLAGRKIFDRVLGYQATRLGDAVSVLAKDYGLREAVASEDEATLASALANHAYRIKAPIALFADTQFVLKASTHAQAEQFLPELRRQAGQAGGRQGVVVLDAQPYQLVIAPVGQPEKLGWVALGFPINAEVLDQVRELSGAGTLLLWRQQASPGWQIVHASVPESVGPALLAQWIEQSRSQALFAAAGPDAPAGVRRWQFKVSKSADAAWAGHVLAHESRLAHAGDQALVVLQVRSTTEATQPYTKLEHVLWFTTAIGVALCTLGGVLMARLITTPLGELTRLAGKLGAGQYAAPLRLKSQDEIGALAGAFETMRCAVAEREAQNMRLAFEDALTGLPNRTRFLADLGRAMSAHAGPVPRFAVLLVDLDRFKQVNDVLGHKFGDRLLCEVAERLRGCVRRDSRDIVARVSGDAFGVLLPGADGLTALDIGRRIERAFEVSICIDDHTVDLGTDIGIACYPAHAEQSHALLSRAEVASREAKRQRSGALIYDSAQDSASEESLSLLSELRHALADHQLRLYLQPKIDLQTGTVIGAEALVRWQHPQRGLIPPVRFIPFAEQTGFIRDLTGWMLDRGTRVMQGLQGVCGALKMSINLSTRDLLDQGLPARLSAMVERQGVAPDRLCLEITESAIMDDPTRALQTLHALRARGFKLSIDDFGTGYSSLAYLKSMPVDELKIDKSFVMNMERDLSDAKIVRSTIDLAHNLGLTVCAEGIENVQAWTLLKSLKCDEAQGYFIARPMPEEQFIDWVEQWRTPSLNAVQLDTDFARLAD